MEIFGYLGAILTIVAVFLISIPSRWGMWLALSANLFWVVFAVVTSQWHMLLQSGVLSVINCMGIYNWTRKKIG